jgi:Uma2 family endonuclease
MAEALAPETKTKLSFEQYLEQYDSYEGGRTEWLAGEVALYPMANNVQHNDLISFLRALLGYILKVKSLGRILLAGISMYYSDQHPAREPDLMILLGDHVQRITPKYVDGIADIVIEVVSPESDERDRGTKFLEYEAAGVPEYWLFDPLREDVAVYALGENGRYRRVPLDEQGRLVSPLLPGFALDPALLWQDVLPDGPEIGDIVARM